MDHVLYFVANPNRAAAESAHDALVATALRVSPVRARGVRIAVETSPMRALARLRSGGADALVLDARSETGSAAESACLVMLRALFAEHAVGAAVSRDRTWLVVDEDARGAVLAFEAGLTRIGGALAGHADSGLYEAIWERIVLATSRRRGGKIALCLAGGGTEGLFYELGVLRALQSFLPHFDLSEIDIVCGISAGAILGGLLANGLGPDEMVRGLRGEPSRAERIKRSDLFDPNLGALAKRAATLSWEVLRGRRSPLSALFRLPPAGVFAGVRLRRWLERQFTKPGMINRFADLPRRLFIGATDQDRSEHVVFGAKGAPEVPIHIAIRASTALVPFYAPEKIDGRYYIDGGFTRTTNMRVAVEEGATLVLLVDPLVPASSPRAGYVAERGGIFVATQGLKSLINGRFDKAIPTLRAMYPHVAFHLFQPGEASRRVMGGSPMKYFFRGEIEAIAYRETVRELRTHRLAALSRDFEHHGVEVLDPGSSSERGNPEMDDSDPLRVVA